MDFDLLLYIIVIVGSILFSVVKSSKKEEQNRQMKKNRNRRPAVVEDTIETEEVYPNQKARTVYRPEQNEEYFSYETMSNCDFERTFAQNAKEAMGNPVKETEKPKIVLTMEEEDVFKGVVWSEILRRKY